MNLYSPLSVSRRIWGIRGKETIAHILFLQGRIYASQDRPLMYPVPALSGPQDIVLLPLLCVRDPAAYFSKIEIATLTKRSRVNLVCK